MAGRAPEARVLQFVADFTAEPVGRLSRSSTLLGDLGLDGDDAIDLLSAFAATFKVDLSSLKVADHFGPEGLPLSFPLHFLRLLLRRGSPEERAGLKPLTLGDLIDAANRGRW